MARAATKAKEEAVQESKELVAQPNGGALALPEGFDFVEEDAGLGLTNVGTEDQAIPFLAILQKGSPQVNRKKDQYIDGAEPGMVFNTVTGELYSGDEGVIVIPVAYDRALLEWRPRDSGGGFAGKHPVDTPLLQQTTKNEKNQDVLPNGNILENTAHHYVLVVHADGRFEQAIIAMKSTQLKKSRKWNSLMKSIVLKRKDGTPFIPPTFLYRYLLTTVFEEKNGNDWYGWKIENAGMLTDKNLYEVAKQFSVAVGEGKVEVKHDAADTGEQHEDNVPF